MATTKKKAAKKAAPVKKAVAKKAPATKAPAKKAAAAKPATAPAPAPEKVKRSTSVNGYLTFTGNCEEAFKHYKSVFGGKFSTVMKFKDAPPMEGQPPLSPEDGNKIMHIALPISKETILMGSDTTGAFAAQTVVGNNFSLSVGAASKPGAEKIFNKLADGGHVVMPMANTFWGSYFGMLVDKFGIQWMVSFDKNPM